MRASKLFLLPLAVLTGLTVLAGCQVAMPTGPSVAIMPASGKPFEVFQNDNALCMQYAHDQIGTNLEHAGQTEVAAGAVTGAVVGAAAGAAMGGNSRSAGAGAGAGTLLGTAIGADNANRSTGSLQRRYDIAYEQCMYAKGNQLPNQSGYRNAPAPTYRAAPLPPPPPRY